MAIDIRKKSDLESIDNLEDFGAFVRQLKPKKIGFWGGRKFSYQDKIDFRLNDIVKRAIFLAKKTIEDSGSDLTAVHALHINVIQYELGYLDIQGNNLLHDPEKTSWIRKILTYCSQFFGNLFYFGALDYRIRELSELCKPYSSGFSFKSKNETLSTIDRYTLIEILESLVKKPRSFNFKDYVFGNKNLHPDELLQLIPTLNLDKNDPRERELLLQFATRNIRNEGYISDQFKEITFDELVNLGFDPQVDRKLFIDFFLQYIERNGDPEIAVEAFIRLGVNPLEEGGLETWEKLINVFPKGLFRKIYTNIKNIGINPLDEKQLLVYIKLLKLWHQKVSFSLGRMMDITGLGTNSLKELKALTTIIRSLSKEGMEDTHIWKFIQNNRINGATLTEHEYLQWLLGTGESINFNIHGALPVGKVPASKDESPLGRLPFDILKIQMAKLHPEALVKVLLSSKNSHLVNAAWMSLIGQDRSMIKQQGNFRGLINFSSPLFIIEHIIRLGPVVEVIDLTGIFYFNSKWNERNTEQLEGLKQIFHACSQLKSLRMDNTGFISKEVVDLFPDTLLQIDFGDSQVSSAIMLPPSVKEVRMRFDKFMELKCQDFQELLPMFPEGLEKLFIGNRGFMEHREMNKMIEVLSIKCRSLRILDIFHISVELNKKEVIGDRLPSIIEKMNCCDWDGTFQEFLAVLPKKIKKLCFTPTSIAKEDFTHLPSTLQSLDIRGDDITEDIGKNNMGSLPAHIKKFRLGRWTDNFRELLPFLHNNLEELWVETIIGEKFIDNDIQHLPIGLKLFRIHHDSILLTEDGKKALKDKGISLIEF